MSIKNVGLVFLVSCLGLNQAFALKVIHEQVILDQLSDYDLCQSKDYSGDWCHDALVRWVKAHPADAFKAGKMTRLKMNHWVAIPFFMQAFSSKKGNCKDEDVSLAVISGLNLPADSNKEIVASSRKIGIELCFPEIKTAILEAATLDSYLFKNVCKDLIAKKALTGLKEKK